MYRQKSFFFPLLLIAAGSLWLLANLGLMPAANLWALTHVWPYLLIALGVSLIVQSQWPQARPLFGLLIVAGPVAAVLFAPQLGWDETRFWNWDFDIRGSVGGSGVFESEQRSPGSFDAIDLRYPADVSIVVGASPSVEIEADDNLLPQLRTRVQGGALLIDSGERNWSRRVNPSRTVQITITVTDLRKISLGSAGNIEATGVSTDRLVIILGGAGNITLIELQAESLDATVSGLGNIEIQGVVDSADIDINGSGNFEGPELYAQDARVQINGLGSATLHVEDHLDAQINGAGSVHYYGSPTVSQDVNGLGSVTRSGE